MSNIDLAACGAVIQSDRCRLYNYVPMREVPGAFRKCWATAQPTKQEPVGWAVTQQTLSTQVDVFSILSVAIPSLTLIYHAPAMR
ncbi:hypothetical protein N826_12580 [Skermanella aerolata KACC 11604]|nr:hypothetical protein N826_12580 [Skermanella aerolata KACC 11604]